MAMAGVSIVNSPLSLYRAPHAYRLFSLPLFSSIPKRVCFQHLPRARHAEKSHAVPACRSGLRLFISWEACSYLGWTFELKAIQKKDFRRQRKCRVAQASLFGVGAPEALVIGVVALLVFGPKGLAEVARTLGKSLRAFQPTIKELQEVSREFKNTLEQEIGLDELRSSTVDSPKSASQSPQRQTIEEQNGPPAKKAYSTEDYLRITEEEIKALTPKEQPKGSDVDAMNNAHPSTAKAGSDVTDLSPKQNGSKEVKANDDNVV